MIVLVLAVVFVAGPLCFFAGYAFRRMLEREPAGPGYVAGPFLGARDPERLASELAAKRGPWRGGSAR